MTIPILFSEITNSFYLLKKIRIDISDSTWYQTKNKLPNVMSVQHRNALACVLTELRSGWQQKPVQNIYHCGVARQKCCLRAVLNKRCISQRTSCCTLIPLHSRPFPTSNHFQRSGEALRTQDQSVPERWDWGEGTGRN